MMSMAVAGDFSPEVDWNSECSQPVNSLPATFLTRIDKRSTTRSTRPDNSRQPRKSTRNTRGKASLISDDNSDMDSDIIANSLSSLKCLQYLVNANNFDTSEKPPVVQKEKNEKIQTNETIMTNLALLKNKLLPVTRRQMETQQNAVNSTGALSNMYRARDQEPMNVEICETSRLGRVSTSRGVKNEVSNCERNYEPSCAFNGTPEIRVTRSMINKEVTHRVVNCDERSPAVSTLQPQTTPKDSKTGSNRLTAQVLFDSPLLNHNQVRKVKAASRIESRSPLIRTSSRFCNVVNNTPNINDDLDDMNDSIPDEDFIVASMMVPEDNDEEAATRAKNEANLASDLTQYGFGQYQQNSTNFISNESNRNRSTFPPSKEHRSSRGSDSNSSVRCTKMSNPTAINGSRSVPINVASNFNRQRSDGNSQNNTSTSGVSNQSSVLSNVPTSSKNSSAERNGTVSSQFTCSVDSLFMSKSQPIVDDDFDSDDADFLNIEIESDDSFSQAIAEMPVMEDSGEALTVLAPSSIQNQRQTKEPAAVRQKVTKLNPDTNLTYASDRSTPICKTKPGGTETPKSLSKTTFKRCQSFQQETSTKDIQTGSQMKQQIELKRQQALERLKQRQRGRGR